MWQVTHYTTAPRGSRPTGHFAAMWVRRRLVPFATLLVLALPVIVLWARPAGVRANPIFVVNSIGDGNDLTPGDGICKTSTPGECTLRAAITEANALANADLINFNIPGAGVHLIKPATALPGVSTQMTIDATTQPGFVGAPLKPAIQLDGSLAGSAVGFVLSGGSSSIAGFAITRFSISGVQIGASDPGGDIVRSNIIGTDSSGSAGLGNTNGVLVFGRSAQIALNNTIAGNTGDGIQISGASANGNRVQGNRIGVGPLGIALPNSTGVDVRDNASGNQIGGDFTTGLGNVISGNAGDGLLICASNSNSVQGNAIGADASGSVAIPNGTGVVISCGAQNNHIGEPSATTGNLISGNTGAGLVIDGAGTTGNLVQANGIGVALSGASAIANGAHGVIIQNGAQSNVIGDATVALSRNYISGNRNAAGVQITGTNTNSNRIENNYIGTDITGTVALGNGIGVLIEGGATGNALKSSLISGNLGDGVLVQDVGTNNNTLGGAVLTTNKIGTNAAGTAVVPNGNCGVDFAGGDGNQVVGNTVSGNGSANICVSDPATNSLVSFNNVGTTADDTATLTNPGPGILVVGETSGTTEIEDNSVGGNTVGIYILSSAGGGASLPLGFNDIGTDSATAAIPLPNSGDGIQISLGSQGWYLTSNVIAFNGGNGVLIVGDAGNTVSQNQIHDNDALGIDLNGDGVTANDLGDGDTGPNNLQNTPVLTSAMISGPNLAVAGALNSTPGTQFTVELFDSPSCDPSGSGEGASFLGSAPFLTDGTGNVVFSFATLPLVPAGDVITATATRNTAPLDTSEFSACVTVTANPDSDGDGCLNTKELGPSHISGGQRDPNDFWDFFDTTGDKSIDLSDTVDVLTYFSDPALPNTPGNLRDRAIPDPLQPWKTEEANDGVDLTDAVNSLRSFGDDCSAP